MKRTRPICLLLALLMLASAVLVSCSGGTDPDEETTGRPSVTDVPASAAPETEPPDPDTVHDLPADLDFDGADFTMATWSGWALLTRDWNGETVNDTKYELELYVEELLNVNVTEYWIGRDMDNIKPLDYYLSGETEVQIFNLLDRDAFNNMLEGIFLPYSSLRYVDLDKKYWYSDIADRLSAGEFQFMTLGSVQLNSFRHAACLFMNLAVAEDYQINVPFDDVDNGTWTFDKLAAYKGVVHHDVDNDGKISKEDSNTFGSTEAAQNALDTLTAADIHFIGKDENKLPVLQAYGNEKLIDALEYCQNLFFDPTDSPWKDEEMSKGSSYYMFVHDRELFMTAKIGDMANGELREMESVYVVLPFPKWDEAQENYISRTFDTLFSMVFNTVEDTDMVGAVLEAMSAYGYQHLIPALIETSLQKKYNNDPRNVKNIQLCFDTRYVEMSDFMIWDIFGDTPTWRLMTDGKFTPSSWLEKYRNKAEGILDDALEDITYLIKDMT